MKTSLKHKFLELTGQQDFAVADENESLIQLMNSKNIDDSAESLRSVLKEHGVRSFKMAEFDAIVSKVKRALALNNTHRHTNNNNGSSGGKRNSKKGKTTKRNIKGKSSTRRSKSWF